MSNVTTLARPSFPIAGVLGVAFIVLKLTGVITWSWWWVLAPFWGPLVIVLALVAVFWIIAGAALTVATLLDKRDVKRVVRRPRR